MVKYFRGTRDFDGAYNLLVVSRCFLSSMASRSNPTETSFRSAFARSTRWSDSVLFRGPSVNLLGFLLVYSRRLSSWHGKRRETCR